jgi:pentatricopeptide repeat protein
MNCLWAIQDWDALVYYRDIREKALNAMQGQDNEEPNDALQRIFFIVNRHMIHALINNGDINEAESLLKSMIESDYDTEYATNELNRIKELRNQSN